MATSDSILIALEEISARRHGSFAIITADASKNYYAQFAADDDAGLYVEVVGNEYLRPKDRLSKAQKNMMRKRGWQGGEMQNWFKEWSNASTAETRQHIAIDALDALQRVYGASGDVHVEVNLEGPSARMASDSLSESENSPVSSPDLTRTILAFVLLGLVLLLFFFLL
ncbi:MAG: hypothetical protein RhofKO_33400 [Rhodothermales bacterium]